MHIHVTTVRSKLLYNELLRAIKDKDRDEFPAIVILTRIMESTGVSLRPSKYAAPGGVFREMTVIIKEYVTEGSGDGVRVTWNGQVIKDTGNVSMNEGMNAEAIAIAYSEGFVDGFTVGQSEERIAATDENIV